MSNSVTGTDAMSNGASAEVSTGAPSGLVNALIQLLESRAD